MDYIVDVGGIALEADYPWVGHDRVCNLKFVHPFATIDGWAEVPGGDTFKLAQVLGPPPHRSTAQFQPG